MLGKLFWIRGVCLFSVDDGMEAVCGIFQIIVPVPQAVAVLIAAEVGFVLRSISKFRNMIGESFRISREPREVSVMAKNLCTKRGY